MSQSAPNRVTAGMMINATDMQDPARSRCHSCNDKVKYRGRHRPLPYAVNREYASPEMPKEKFMYERAGSPKSQKFPTSGGLRSQLG